MRKHLLTYCVIAFTFSSLQLNAQINAVGNHIPIENIKLITDRNIYLSGEKIWFTAFYASPQSTSAKSKVLYTEVFNSAGEVILKAKFDIDGDASTGTLLIPEEAPTGTYYVRAYTKYQRNFHPESYANVPVRIFNPEITASEGIPADTNMIDITAVGGALLKDIPSEAAFRLLPDWLPQIDSLFLSIGDSMFVKRIPFYKNGLGRVEFIPNASEKYFIQIKLKNGDTIPKALPEVKKDGLIFRPESVGMFYNLIAFQSGEANPMLKVNLVSKEHIAFYRKDFKINGNKSVLEIPVYSIPPGVNFLIVENEAGSQIFAHAFLKDDDRVKLKVETDKKLYGQREKVSLNFSSDEDSISGLFSIAVVKSGSIGNPELLAEALITNPILLDDACFGVFLSDKQIRDQINISLELYDAYLKKNPPIIMEVEELCKNPGWLPETRGPSISGIVQDKETDEGIMDHKIMAATLFKNQQLHINESRKNGRFDINLAYPEGKQTVYLVAEPMENKKPEILVFNDFSPDFPRLLNASFSPDTSRKLFFEELLVNKQILDRFANDPKTEETTEGLPYWYGEPTATYLLDDYIEFNTMTEVFHEIIPNVRLRTEGGTYHFRIYDDRLNVFYDDPLVLIDNTPVFNINKITKIFPAQVKKIDVINRTYILGHRFIRGIISIRTKTNDLAGIEFPDDAVFYEYLAPADGMIFPEKRYDTKIASAKLPDFRTVLYWNPGIRTIQDAHVEFYTSDHASDYDLIIRGITSDGHPCYGRSKIRVGK
ncbi:MAG: hypothetical protein K9H13_04825 [Bacteroidales bacterium]|nr:hypothetical protein [Bacteroidales bacterium]MCF8343941.1 hypothetical protein [Bacteroidales bacterium]MCF8401938.1 hypothetical protein [Bacteroidales bacterium]